MRLTDLETPALVLDRERLLRNLARMRERVHARGAGLRPHVKTAKSIDVVRLALAGEPGGITVSTLKEAEYFFAHGIRDIVYAVGIAPAKFGHAFELIKRGADLKLLLDSPQSVAALSRAAQQAGVVVPVFIELDVDGHRSGVPPESALLLELGHAIARSANLRLQGVLTHAGDSYGCRGVAELENFAERERSGAVRAARRLRDADIDVPVVSVGSTPTATFATNFAGVTEVRVGVYMFHDLVMAGLGVCAVDDIAMSVLVSVIGHRPDRGWIITDGGWTALSRDRGTSTHEVDQGYGLVRDLAGREILDDLIVLSTNQEHGVVGRRVGGPLDLHRFPIGTLLRVLPNHACATGTQHAEYRVVEGDSPQVVATWSRFSGW